MKQMTVSFCKKCSILIHLGCAIGLPHFELSYFGLPHDCCAILYDFDCGLSNLPVE